MKKNLVLLFGGASSEHEVSCKSAVNIARCISSEKYKLFLIGITKDGRWLSVEDTDSIENGSWTKSPCRAVLLPDAKRKSILLEQSKSFTLEIKVDVVFPVLHGKNGEDGTIQGLLELARIPYVGCGVLSSAVCMDKGFTKLAAAARGIRQAAYIELKRRDLADMDSAVGRIEKALPYPIFVKPANAGSSCGVSKAGSGEELKKSLLLAAEQDSKIIVEEFIKGREVECAVFGGGNVPAIASGIGEILAGADFYDYDAKYNNPSSLTITDPDVDPETVETIRREALEIYDAVDAQGLSRVDFFIREDGQVIFNEINTLPGFTAISMYPMLWEARGITKAELVDRLIDTAFGRFE